MFVWTVCDEWIYFKNGLDVLVVWPHMTAARCKQSQFECLLKSCQIKGT